MPFPTAYGVSAGSQARSMLRPPAKHARSAVTIAAKARSCGTIPRPTSGSCSHAHRTTPLKRAPVHRRQVLYRWVAGCDRHLRSGGEQMVVRSPDPTGGCVGAATTLQGKLYFVGCRDPNSSDSLTLVFDPKLGTWSQAAAPAIRAGVWLTLSRVVVNGQPRLELIGGAVPGTNWQFNP